MEISEGVNIPLLRKVVEWAEAEAAKPESLCEWDQGFWILPRTEDDPALRRDGNHPQDSSFFTRVRGGLDSECGTCFCIAGKVVFDAYGSVKYTDAGMEAAGLLGLTASQAVDLFGDGNTIDDVRRIAEDLAGERL